ncbi:MAG: efflux RND transporter periplasmic adaptor subunit [Proteobacteria bacterium]|nr:efflux RND transporter periplasmic adaptor subunit [Burkholderiales bacterium]
MPDHSTPGRVHSRRRRFSIITGCAVVVTVAVGAWIAVSAYDSRAQNAQSAQAEQKSGKGARPSLSVETVVPELIELPTRIAANGNVAAWQEAVIGAEVSGLRLTEVRVNVGDVVKAGAVLAVFSSDSVTADLALQRASLAEAEATLGEARANADRARQVQASGALSAQQVGQFLTAESTARARVDAARAQVQSQELRMKFTRIVAPDSGIISARSATVGAIAQPGQELFRLIRQGRLEWRAEVPAAQLHQIRVTQPVKVVAPSGEVLDGRVRMVGPTVDNTSRNALVYVDLRVASMALKAGMFVRGEIDMGTSRALALPQSAVLLREGFAYVYRLDSDSRVAQTKVEVGRREGERIEITRGLDASMRVVKSGVAFLADGDTVRIVDKPASLSMRPSVVPSSTVPSSPATPTAQKK